MQLCISSNGTKKVHTKLLKNETSLVCNLKACGRKHVHSSSRAYKSIYTEGFKLSNDVTLETLLTKGFSSFLYASQPLASFSVKRRQVVGNPCDTTNGYRNSDNAISLLTTHWQDYDVKTEKGEVGVPIDTLMTRWVEGFPGVGVDMILSQSGVGVRLLYEGRTAESGEEGEHILEAELAAISGVLQVTLDSSKTGQSSYSAHLLAVEAPTKEEIAERLSQARSVVGGALDIDIPPYSQRALTTTTTGRRLTVGEDHINGLFKGLHLQPSEPTTLKQTGFMNTLPSDFVFVQRGKSIGVAQLVLQCMAASGKKPSVTTAEPYVQGGTPMGSNPEPVIWWYDSERQMLMGKVTGNAVEFLAEERNVKVTKSLRLLYSLRFTLDRKVMAPDDRTKYALVSGSIHLSPTYQLVDILILGEHNGGATSLSVIHDYENIRQLFPYIMKMKNKPKYFLVPGNPIKNLPDTYTIGVLMEELYHIGFIVVLPTTNEAGDIISGVEDNAKVLNSYFATNCPNISSTEFKYGYTDVGHSVDGDILTLYGPYHALRSPEYDRPSDGDMKLARTFFMDYQGYDIDLEARIVTSRMYDIQPDGLRKSILYDNNGPGVGKSEQLKAKVEIGIAPRIEASELFEEGLNGLDANGYSSYRLPHIDEADQLKGVARQARKMTSNGMATRASKGVSQQITFNAIELCSATGIKEYKPEVMDTQEADRLFVKAMGDGRGYQALKALGKVPLKSGDMLAALSWCIYESYLEYEEKWDRHTTLHSEDFKDAISAAPSTQLARLALYAIAEGFDTIREDTIRTREEPSKHSHSVRLLDYTGAPVMHLAAAKREAPRGQDAPSSSGIYVSYAGTIYMDSLEVLFTLVDELGLDGGVKTLLNNNRALATKMLGVPLGKRSNRSVAGGEDNKGKFFSISEFDASKLLPYIWGHKKYVPHKFLVGKTLEELEFLYETGSKALNPNYSQLAEVAYYYSLNRVDEPIVTVVVHEDRKLIVEDLFNV